MKYLLVLFLFVGGPLSGQSSLFHEWKDNSAIEIKPVEQQLNCDPLNCYSDSSDNYKLVDISYGQYVQLFDGHDFLEYDVPFLFGRDYIIPFYRQSINQVLIPENEIPQFSVFCRMEALSYSHLNVMFSVHAGGFNEQDELCR